MKPRSNGLAALHDETDEANGFGCMKLIGFLTADAVTEWDERHQTHLDAERGQCPYKARCPIYECTARKHLPLFAHARNNTL